MQSQISFDVTKQEAEIIRRIANRARQIAADVHEQIDLFPLVMDLTAAHANGNPLKLGELLSADDGNFSHDVFGIRRHLDRETGQLMDCFVPRYSQ